MSSQSIIDDNSLPMEICCSSGAPAEPSAPTLDHIIANDSTTILNVEEFTCHYDADTDINSAIDIIKDDNDTDGSGDITNVGKLELLPMLNVCRMCYMVASTFHRQRNADRYRYVIVGPICCLLHTHTSNVASITKALMEQQRPFMVDGLITPAIDAGLSRELNNLNLVMFLSENPQEYDNIDGVKMMETEQHVDDFVNMCHQLKPIAKIVFTSFSTFAYSVLTDRLKSMTGINLGKKVKRN